MPGLELAAAASTFPPSTIVPASIDALWNAIYSLQYQMADLANRLDQVERRQPSPAIFLPLPPVGLPDYSSSPLTLMTAPVVVSTVSSSPAPLPNAPAPMPLFVTPSPVPLTTGDEVQEFVPTAPDDVDTEPIKPAVDTSVLSLHAMAEIRTEETRQLHISIANQQFVELLGPSSPHYSHSVIARQTDLTFNSSAHARAHVTVANGGSVACWQGFVRDVASHLGAGEAAWSRQHDVRVLLAPAMACRDGIQKSQQRLRATSFVEEARQVVRAFVSSVFDGTVTVASRHGRLNTLLEDLSRRGTDELLAVTLSGTFIRLCAVLCREPAATAELSALRDGISIGHQGAPWLVCGGVFLYSGHDFMQKSLTLLYEVLKLAHTVDYANVHHMLQWLLADTSSNLDHDKFLAGRSARLLQAQDYARHHYGARHCELQSSRGAWVWFLLLHRSVQYCVAGSRGQPGPGYARQVHTLACMDTVAGTRINDEVPVGVLQLFRAPSLFQVLALQPSMSKADTPWEPVEMFCAAPPCFQLEDELFVDGGQQPRVALAGPIFVGYSPLLKKDKAVVVQPHRVTVGNSPTFGCVMMDEFLSALECVCTNTTAYDNYSRIFVPDGQPPEYKSGEPLRVNILFKIIQRMPTGGNAIIAEMGDSWFNCQKLRLPDGCGYEFRMQYGSIAWSVGMLFGYTQDAADKCIACIDDGSFQVMAQNVSLMLWCEQRSLIFLIDNWWLVRAFISSCALRERNQPEPLHSGTLLQLIQQFCKLALMAEHRVAHAQQLYADSYFDHGRGELFTVMCARVLRAQAFVLYQGAWAWPRLYHGSIRLLVTGPGGILERTKFSWLNAVWTYVDSCHHQLHEGAHIHVAFHMGTQQTFQGLQPMIPLSLPPLQHGILIQQSTRLRRASIWRDLSYLLPMWASMSATEATWVPLAAFQVKNPSFQLEDELLVEGGRSVMVGKYQCQKHRG